MSAVATRTEFALLADLAKEGSVTATSLYLDPSTSYEAWEALGAMLGRLNHASAWLIGDWVDFGERAYGEKYAQAVEDTGLALQTLMNYASVARRVPPERRRATVPFSFHAVVAALDPAEQEKWLEKAEEEGLTRRNLEAAVTGRPEKVSVRDLAAAVWASATLTDAGDYLVPAAPMRALGGAL